MTPGRYTFADILIGILATLILLTHHGIQTLKAND